MGMRLYWLADRVEQLGREPGERNQGEYFTKSYSLKHNQKMQSMYLVGEGQPKCLPRFKPSILRGCVDNSVFVVVISLAQRKITLERQSVLTAKARRQTTLGTTLMRSL